MTSVREGRCDTEGTSGGFGDREKEESGGNSSSILTHTHVFLSEANLASSIAQLLADSAVMQLAESALAT